MPMVVYKSHYIRGGSKAGNYISYIGTRPGVIKIAESRKNEAATANQNAYIESFAKSFPDIKESEQYKDYAGNRTLGNASELISFLEETYPEDQAQGVEGYLQYMATRPGTVKTGTNGLFSDDEGIINLSEIKDKISRNRGIIFTPIVSLTREDAETFGYTSPKKWQNLIKAHRNEIAQLYRIDPDNFEWYGAFHNEPNHPHIHLVFFSKNGRQGWQNPDYTFEKMKRLLSKDIVSPYRQQIYEQKNELRQTIRQTARIKINQLLDKIEKKEECPEQILRLMLMLKESMKDYKGKQVYGYLPVQQKRIVDNIADELEKDPDIKEFLSQWDILQGNLQALYRQDGFQHIPLSQAEDFKPVKNMIISAAMKIPDSGYTPFTVAAMPSRSAEKEWMPFHIYRDFAFVAKRIAKDYYNAETIHKKSEQDLEEEFERKIAQGIISDYL